MRTSLLARNVTASLIAACQIAIAGTSSPDFRSGAVKTSDGYIHVYNNDGIHYTLRSLASVSRSTQRIRTFSFLSMASSSRFTPFTRRLFWTVTHSRANQEYCGRASETGR